MSRDRERHTETLDPELVFDPTTRRVSTRALHALIVGSVDDEAPTQIPGGAQPPPLTPRSRRVLEELKARRSGEAVAEPFGRYVLLGSVGKGGMAEVRLAALRAEESPRLCVVKRTALGREGAVHLARGLREEGRVMKMLVHQNIVQLIDDGELGGSPFLVFELIDGVSVREMIELVKPARVPLNGVLEIGRACASALAHAHARGVVHRDVTPQNVLVARNGAVKVVDFGIARFEGREHETRQGHVKGKLGYMAPEQCRSGEPVDGKTDVFTLGLVLTELIGGARVLPPLFILPAESEPLVRRRLAEAQEPVPTALADLLVHMTALDAADRPSAEEVERRLAIEVGGETLAEFVDRAVFADLEPFESGVALDPPPDEPTLEPTESDPFSYAMTLRRLRPSSVVGPTRRVPPPPPPATALVSVSVEEPSREEAQSRALFFFVLALAMLGFGSLLYVLMR